MDARLVYDDGAFWMSFEDFLSNFFSINVCMVSQPITSSDDGKTRVPWVESRERFTYELADGEEGKEVHAPSYSLTLADEAKHVLVSVHQKDTRCMGAGPYIDIGVTVMKVTPETKSGFTLMASTGSSCDRQNQTESLCLPAGKYVIMPMSTGCKLSNVSNLIIIIITVIVIVIFAIIIKAHSIPIKHTPHTQCTPSTRAGTIVVHCSVPHTLMKISFNHDAIEDAIELLIMEYGTCKELVPGNPTPYRTAL
jgi:Calpain large subunit, domain III